MYFWYSVKNLLPYAGSSTALGGVVPSILSTAEASRCSGATPHGGSCCGGGGGGRKWHLALVAQRNGQFKTVSVGPQEMVLAVEAGAVQEVLAKRRGALGPGGGR